MAILEEKFTDTCTQLIHKFPWEMKTKLEYG